MKNAYMVTKTRPALINGPATITALNPTKPGTPMRAKLYQGENVSEVDLHVGYHVPHGWQLIVHAPSGVAITMAAEFTAL